uniref:GIY-YIG domain-containing protein n=1 Tax=Rhabditophanes sp. KR3021 TaxID=114890 RepID=A0AC35TYQ7_9BILA
MELQKKDVAVLTPDMVKIDSNSKTAATDSNNNSAEDGGLNIKDQLTAGMTKKDDTDQDQKSSVVNIHQVVDALATQAGGLSLESSKELDSFVDDDDSDSSEEEDVKLSDSKKSNYRRNIEHTKNCNAMVNYVIGRNGTKNVYKLLRENDKSGKFYVYALLSGKEMPKTIEEFLFRLIYIGKGTGSRMDQHYSKLYNERWDSNEEKRKELRDLLNSRKGFIGIKIVENLSETLSLVLESPLIDKYSKQLLNKATGITIEQFDETLTTEICGQIWKDVEENLKAKDLVCKPYFLKETDKCLKLAKKKFQTITCEKCDGKIISKRQNQIHNRLMKKDNCSEEVTCPCEIMESQEEENIEDQVTAGMTKEDDIGQEPNYKFDMSKSTKDERSLHLKNANSKKISEIEAFHSLMPEIIGKVGKNGERIKVSEEEKNLITYGSEDRYVFKCTPICQCPEGHEFESSINGRTKHFVSRGRVTGCLSCISCKTCHYNSMKTHAPEAYANLCKSEDCHVRKKENVVPIKKYENIARQSHSKVCMECPKCETHHSQVVYSIVNQGPCCHDCDDKVSVLHGKTKELLLAKYGERVHPEHKFDDCRGKKNRLPFDIFISPSLLVEVDGAQHFNAGSFGMTKEKLMEQQANDKIKNEYCRQEGLSLVRIAYSEYSRIDEIVEEFIKAYDNLNDGERYEKFFGKVYKK